MKTIIALLVIFLISFSGFSQEDDTSGYTAEYQLVDYTTRTFLDFIPTEENEDWDRYSKVTYRPIVNYDVLDSVVNWRASKGASKIIINWDKVDRKMSDYMYNEAMQISKVEGDKITLCKSDNVNTKCECTNSIIASILDDSLTYLIGKHEIPFKTFLLDKKMKSIEIYYYQLKRESGDRRFEHHLIVMIKRRFRLFTNVYEIF
jgi:hypothetical protein